LADADGQARRGNSPQDAARRTGQTLQQNQDFATELRNRTRKNTRRGRFFYQRYFAAESVAEAELEADIHAALRRFYYAWSGDAPAGTGPADRPADGKAGDGVLLRVSDCPAHATGQMFWLGLNSVA
jgi:hypothetical protein